MTITKILTNLQLAVFFIILTGCEQGIQPNADETDNTWRVAERGDIQRIAGAMPDLEPSHVRGARLYDDLIRQGEGAPPAGDNPLLVLASASSTLAGPDSWRCSQCHGYDFEGGAGKNGANNNLLELREVRGFTEEYVWHVLNGFNIIDDTGAVQMVHDYTFLSEQNRRDLSDFITNEIFDTSVYLKAVANGAAVNAMDIMPYGEAIWNGTVEPLPADTNADSLRDVQGVGYSCSKCHAVDSAVTDAQVYGIAKTDPWYFMFRTLFGSPRAGGEAGVGDPTKMPGLYEIIQVNALHFGGSEQGAAVLAHAQAQP